MKIAVVVPCRNEVQHIESCVRAIYAQELPERAKINVYMVDGKSSDGTQDVLNRLIEEFPSLMLVENRMEVTPFAFNLGIHAGKGADYIQIVGARQILSPNYMKGAIQVLEQRTDVWCVGGRVENEYLNAEGEIIAKAMSTAFGMGLGNFRTLQESGYTDTVGTPMYPAWVFEKIGFFDEELIRNQDDDFNFRVTQAGGKIYYEHEISLKYFVRGSYAGLRRQFYQYGYWKVYVNQKHKAVTTLRQLVPPAFVLYACTFPLAYLFGIHFGAFWNLPLAIYVFMLLYFSMSKADSAKAFFGLLKTYTILHFGYGFGYLHGLWDFVVRNKKPSENQKQLSR